MPKLLLMFFLAFALLLSACASTTPTQIAEPSATITQLPKSTATSASSLPEGEIMVGCKVVDNLPPLDPTLQALFPGVSEQDWVKGPDSAFVTIIEYSDFQ